MPPGALVRRRWFAIPTRHWAPTPSDRALARVPNSDEVFLVMVQNRVYHFDLWRTMTGFEELPESVKQINSVESEPHVPRSRGGAPGPSRTGRGRI